MPVIRIDDEVFKALQERAVPLLDTPNSVLRRLLGLDKAEGKRDGGRRMRTALETKRVATEGGAFRVPILRALVELGGRAPCRVVLDRVEQRMANSLTDFDREDLPSGQRVRWRENAEWERYHMVREGLLERGSPRGIWEITDEGRENLQSG